MKSPKKWLLAIFLLAIVLRLLFIRSREIQYDDAFSYFLAASDLDEIIAGTAADTMPPLYYFILHFWLKINNSVAFLRLLSVSFNLISIYFVYKIAQKGVGLKTGLWAAFLTSISPIQIYHAQDIRMYALLEVLQAGYILAFVYYYQSSDRKNNLRYLFAMVFCGVLAMYTHNLAVFVLVVPDLFLVWRRKWRQLSQLLFAQGVIGLLTLPWLLMLPGQLDKIQQAFWTPRPGLVEIIQSVIMFTATLPLPMIWMIVVAVISVQVLVIILLENKKNRENREEIVFLGSLAIVPPLLLFIISYVMKPIFIPRAFLFSSLAYFILASIPLTHMWPKAVSIFLSGGFVASALISLPFQYTFNNFPRSPYNKALQYVSAQMEMGDRIIHDNKLSYFPCKFYAPDLPQFFLPDEPGSSNDTLAYSSQKAMSIYPEVDLVSAVGNTERIFFIYFKETVAEYGESNLPHPALAWFDQYYSFISQESFNDLEVRIYERLDGLY